MAIDINNTASVNLVSNTRLRQLPAPSDNPQLRQPAVPINSVQQENIIPLDSASRQTIASSVTSAAANQQQSSNQDRSVDLSASVNELNRAVQTIERKLEFRVDDNSGRTVITVRDSYSDEVIRQIPSDQLLQLSARLQEIESDKSSNPGVEAQGVLFTSKT